MRSQLLEDAPSAHSQSTTSIAQIDPVPRVSIQAFCESPEAASVIQAAVGDRRMNKAHIKQNMGGAAAAVEAYRNAPTPNVIVIEATADRDLLVGQLDELAEYCDAGTRVIVIGKVNDIVLYRQLIARGLLRPTSTPDAPRFVDNRSGDPSPPTQLAEPTLRLDKFAATEIARENEARRQGKRQQVPVWMREAL